MVQSIIISDLNCQILYSTMFDFKQSAVDEDNLAFVVRKVKAEFDFNYTVSNSNNNQDVSNTSMLDFETKGILNINLKKGCKSAVYHSFCGCLYIFLCDSSDNRLLAYRTLVLLIRTLRDAMPKLTSYTSEFIVRADAVSMVIHAFVPSGQLIFLNDQAVQQISKDLLKLLR